PQGEAGPTGAAGPAGPAGKTGPAGPAGAPPAAEADLPAYVGRFVVEIGGTSVPITDLRGCTVHLWRTGNDHDKNCRFTITAITPAVLSYLTNLWSSGGYLLHPDIPIVEIDASGNRLTRYTLKSTSIASAALTPLDIASTGTVGVELELVSEVRDRTSATGNVGTLPTASLRSSAFRVDLDGIPLTLTSIDPVSWINDVVKPAGSYHVANIRTGPGTLTVAPASAKPILDWLADVKARTTVGANPGGLLGGSGINGPTRGLTISLLAANNRDVAMHQTCNAVRPMTDISPFATAAGRLSLEIASDGYCRLEAG
ncbi:MAG: hypothetical protein REI11_21525, partial [Patulibacter sp.]|nr:hypothetical protein [Patulibacter sp.]